MGLLLGSARIEQEEMLPLMLIILYYAPLCRVLLHFFNDLLRALEVAPSLGWRSLSTTGSPHRTSNPVQIIIVAFTELAPIYQSLSCMGRTKNWTQHSRCSLMKYHYVSIKHTILCLSPSTEPFNNDFKCFLHVKRKKKNHNRSAIELLLSSSSDTTKRPTLWLQSQQFSL